MFQGLREGCRAVHVPGFLRVVEHLSLKVCQTIRKSFSPAFVYLYKKTPTCIQGGSKLERARDLFEQALEKCPPKSCKPIFLLYAQLEEEYGLAKRAMSIYDRATQVVENEDKLEVSCFFVYLHRALTDDWFEYSQDVHY